MMKIDMILINKQLRDLLLAQVYIPLLIPFSCRNGRVMFLLPYVWISKQYEARQPLFELNSRHSAA
jgi:hypothetical protein